MGKKARLRRKTQEQEGTVTYWHGGRAGRAVGDHLIPGTEIINLAGGPDLSQFPWFHDYRPDFAYITTDRDLALDFGIRSIEERHAA